MFKKLIAIMLASLFVLSAFVGCAETGNGDGTNDSANNGDNTAEGPFGTDGTKPLTESGVVSTVASEVTEGTKKDVKIGVVLIGDESETYSKAHIDGIAAACEALGMDSNNSEQVIWKMTVGEDAACSTAIEDLVAQGCNLIITNSYGHQDHTKAAAEKYRDRDIQFIAMTGDTAARTGLDNFANAFTEVYQSRYVSGIVAGMKLKELVDAGKITDENKDKDGNIKLGYVGAFPFAEVVSGYTAFYLGIKSVVDNVVMDVQYTGSWHNRDSEYQAAQVLINRGAVIIGQHADSEGAPTAVQEAYDNGKAVYSVGYNIDLTKIGAAVLTSATNNWSVYYEYAIKTVMNGGKVATNWVGGYTQDAVKITALGTQAAEGTEAKVNEVEAAIKAGTLHVFDTSKFTVDGKTVTWAYAADTDGNFVNDSANVIANGYYHESYNQSAPSFSLRIDGITELNPDNY